MKYHRVTAHSFWWLKWCCSLYMLLMVIFLTACVVTKNISFTIVLAVMILILVMFFTVVRHTNFYKAGKISRLIQKHIEENQLYETAFRGRKFTHFTHKRIGVWTQLLIRCISASGCLETRSICGDWKQG